MLSTRLISLLHRISSAELELLQEENVRIVTCKDEEMSELDSLLNAIREEVKYCKLVEGSADDLAGTVRVSVPNQSFFSVFHLLSLPL